MIDDICKLRRALFGGCEKSMFSHMYLFKNYGSIKLDGQDIGGSHI